MSNFIRNIRATELRKYITSSKGCKVSSSGCRLLPKRAHILFNFGVFGNITKCQLVLKKLGGNGAIGVVQPPQGNLSIYSKSAQKLDVNLDNGSVVKIIRPTFSTGEVEILGVTLHLDREEKDNATSGQHMNWKSIIAQCGNYKGIHLVRGKLFASEGGFIDNAHSIKNVETEPPNLYTRIKDKIKFTSSCQVLNIEFGGYDNTIPISQELFISREEPTPVIAADKTQVAIDSDIYGKPISIDAVKNIITSGDENQLASRIIYDSHSMHGFDAVKANTSKKVKCLKSNGKNYLLIKNGGECKLPISLLKPDTNYICVVHGKKLNGNGGVFVSFSTKPGDPPNEQKLVVGVNETNYFINLKTDSMIAYGEFYKLQINMQNSASTGEILLNRILIIEDSVDRPSREDFFIKGGVDTSPLTTLVVDCDKENNVYYKKSKIFARYCSDKVSCAELYDKVNGKIAAMTVSGIRWVNKINPSFPNMLFVNNKVNSRDMLLIGQSGALRKSNKIWIDVFDQLSPKDIKILRSAQTILTPSEVNKEILEKEFPDKNIAISYKALPYVKPKPINVLPSDKFVLAFDRDKETTKYLVKLWSKNLPTLALVGSRGGYPGYVLPINEYMPYNELLYLILNAACIVDIIPSCEYISSFLHMAKHAGVPIVSNNGFIKDNESCTHLPDRKELAPSTLISSIKKAHAGKGTISIDQSYNKILKEQVSNMFTC
jgi:hypothetical protein